MSAADVVRVSERMLLAQARCSAIARTVSTRKRLVQARLAVNDMLSKTSAIKKLA
jgi:hypothetical protein